jgi:hypothetical protein
MDKGFTYPYADEDKVIVVASPDATANGRIWKKTDLVTKFGANWMHYRWKVYSLVVRPKNLN